LKKIEQERIVQGSDGKKKASRLKDKKEFAKLIEKEEA
jgi:hypothetical protein